MRVVFTKGPGTGYGIAVHREKWAVLAPRDGPGGHRYLPHDLVHFLVEAEAGIALGVYGRPAAGDNGMFWPADPAERVKAARRRTSKPAKSTPRARQDAGRSEHLADVAVRVWEVRRGHAPETSSFPPLRTAPPRPEPWNPGRLRRGLHPGRRPRLGAAALCDGGREPRRWSTGSRTCSTHTPTAGTPCRSGVH
jgi:hypothetical protein